MEAYYDSKPVKLEAVGNGSYIYRMGIQEIEMSLEEESPRTQWKCEEVVVWSPITANKITEAVITSLYDANYEQKLVNEYNSAKLGLYGPTTGVEAKARIKSYTDFLEQRKALKVQIDADYAEIGIM